MVPPASDESLALNTARLPYSIGFPVASSISLPFIIPIAGRSPPLPETPWANKSLLKKQIRNKVGNSRNKLEIFIVLGKISGQRYLLFSPERID
jgi:hypothetical protein